MNVLHINQSDLYGGAGIAGYRLHQGLLAQGVNSRLIVGTMISKEDRVSFVPPIPHIEKKFLGLTKRYGLNYLNIISTYTIIPKHPFFLDAHILNFHNLHSGYFNYTAIPFLNRRKPIVLTLHDMWSFTGHCAYSYDCNRWITGCGRCPYPESYPSVIKDNTHLEWRLKRWAYKHSNLTVVAPSKWLEEEARKSILKHFSIRFIPHGIDTQAYVSLSREECKSVLGIPTDKKVLMFGAPNLSDTRKGGDLLLKALEIIPSSLKSEMVLITIGDQSGAVGRVAGIDVLGLGYVTNDRFKSIAYSAADVFVFPTRADIFGLVLLESMACGTPIVSFSVGGVPDLVRPGVTGFLAEPEDYRGLSSLVVQVLEDDAFRKKMGRQCREIAEQEYSLELQAKRYINLYDDILRGD